MTVAAVWTIQLIQDETSTQWLPHVTGDAIMAETEENLTDLLPPGWTARIRRGDDNTDEPTQEDDDE